MNNYPKVKPFTSSDVVAPSIQYYIVQFVYQRKNLIGDVLDEEACEPFIVSLRHIRRLVRCVDTSVCEVRIWFYPEGVPVDMQNFLRGEL